MSDNISALIYLKNKVHKWKNISILSFAFCAIVLLKLGLGGSSLSSSDNKSDFIANINVEGIIFEDDYRSKILKKISQDKYVKGVIININSPGGGIVGSEILFEDIKNIANKKPLVVLMGSVAASGGYMAAIASDYIIARNGTLTGSIGVLMESPEVTELAKKIGVKFNTYKSSPLKGSPSPFEKPNIIVNRVIQDSIDDSYDFFKDLVIKRRGAKIQKQNRSIVFDGRIFTGRQALRAGLVDAIGGQEQALNYLSSRKVNIKLPVKKVEIKEDKKKFLEKFFGFLPFFDKLNSSNHNSKIMAILPI